MSRCPSCGYEEAILYNPWNKVVQCHNCGQVVDVRLLIGDEEKVIFT